MRQGDDVIGHAGSVHEDQRPLTHRQVRHVAAWRLPLPALEVEQAVVFHHPEPPSQFRIEPIEDVPSPFDELASTLEGTQGWPAERVDADIPRPEGVDSELLAVLGEDPLRGGNDPLEHGFVERVTIGGRVVVPMLFDVRVVAKVRETSLAGDLLTQPVLIAEKLGELIPPLDIRTAMKPPGAFPDLAVRVEHERT